MATQRKRRLPYFLGIAAVTLYVATALVLYVIQRQLVFPGQNIKVQERPPSGVAGLEVLRVSTSTGMTEAWYLPPLDPPDVFPSLIFGHGNGEVIDMWVDQLDQFRKWGLGVMLVEYPGYGRSEGRPSELGIREAMTGAYDLLLDQPGVDPTRVVGYGQSLGGGAIAALSERRPLRAMILQSTFTSVRAFAARFWMPGFLVGDPFHNLAAVERFSGPILVLHGRRDELIPYQQGTALARGNDRAELRLYECGHVCWEPKDLPIILADIHRFLEASAVLPAHTTNRSSNKPLQPTRAAQPNGQREPAGSGPRG